MRYLVVGLAALTVGCSVAPAEPVAASTLECADNVTNPPTAELYPLPLVAGVSMEVHTPEKDHVTVTMETSYGAEKRRVNQQTGVGGAGADVSMWNFKSGPLTRIEVKTEAGLCWVSGDALDSVNEANGWRN